MNNYPDSDYSLNQNSAPQFYLVTAVGYISQNQFTGYEQFNCVALLPVTPIDSTYSDGPQVIHPQGEGYCGPYPPHTTALMIDKKKPTIIPNKLFDPVRDAEELRKATKDFGTDEETIIKILSNRTNQERMKIIDQYENQMKRDLIKDLKSDISGSFGKVVIAMMTPLADFLAKELHDAMYGLGTDEDTLIEILCTSNNACIQAINDSYQKLYQRTLKHDIKDDTSGYFTEFLALLCQGRRDEIPYVNIKAAKLDAEILYKEGVGRFGTNESIFNMILCTKNVPHLRQVFIEYENLTGETIKSAIKKEFSFDIQKGLIAIVHIIEDSPRYFAKKLHKCIYNLVRNDRNLIRILVTRAEIDLGDICIAYEKKYFKSLINVIEGDTSGDYKKMLVALVS